MFEIGEKGKKVWKLNSQILFLCKVIVLERTDTTPQRNTGFVARASSSSNLKVCKSNKRNFFLNLSLEHEVHNDIILQDEIQVTEDFVTPEISVKEYIFVFCSLKKQLAW